MFETLTDRLKQSFQTFRGQSKLSESNVTEALQAVRQALLEADVALPVVTSFLEDVKNRVLGETVTLGLNPSDVFIKKVQEALTQLMGTSHSDLNLATTPPAVILVTGLQGAGKTTTVGKLAYWLKTQHKKSVLIASVDIYRAAAIQQLESLAEAATVSFYPSQSTQSPLEIAQAAIQQAKIQAHDVVIIDSAGRLHIDEPMMAELEQLHTTLQPTETLLVVDGMMGQDAAQIAQTFNERLSLTGVILTKMESDTRGGAALSLRFITQKPIKFIGNGEKIQALETFHPDRIASRILGMGDIVSLVETVQQHTDEKVAHQLSSKIRKGQVFNLQDFLEQLQQMQKLGSMESLLDKLPGISQLRSAAAQATMDPKHIRQMTAIIYAMTPKERRFPHLIQGSRKRRIAKGSGTTLQDISRLLKQFEHMQKMMKQFSTTSKLHKLMRYLPQHLK